MRIGTENRQKTIIAAIGGVLALGACVYLYEELFATGPAPAPQAPVVVASAPVVTQVSGQAGGNAAKTVGKTSAALDPTLHMEAMLVSESVEYSGTGRNIFSASSVPVGTIPEAIAAARPKPVVALPPPPPKTCPPDCPPPPPIPLKFFGFETSAKGARAVLLHDDDVIVASAGDIVMRRYRVTAINAKSIQVQDMQNNNTQMLPLLAN
jgi:hypothetical protein